MQRIPQRPAEPAPGGGDGSSYAVVGTGLAGCVLALRLLAQGRAVRVYSRADLPPASLAALGVVNPVTGMRFTPTYRFAEALPAAVDFYQYWEKAWGVRLWYPGRIHRFFTSAVEKERCLRRGDLAVQPAGQNPWAPFLPADCPGALVLEGGGWLDMPALLAGARAEFTRRGCLVELTPNEPVPAADRTIYCEGYAGLAGNPLLQDIPRRSAKGEMLLLHAPDLPPGGLAQRGLLLAPTAEPSIWRAGATYGWDDLTPQPTSAGRRWLEEQLQRNFRFEYKITGHLAGVRPIVTDKLPILGPLAGRAGQAVFNGLGSKGALLAPWAAEILLAHLEYGAALPAELDVRRNFPH